jgi:predicted aspartyl protease
MKVFSSITAPCTVAKLEALCIQAAHAGHAQATIKVNGNVIQVVIDENQTPLKGENK